MLGLDEPLLAPLAFAATAEPAEPAHEDFLRLAEASPAMIWMADNEGLCTFANQSWLDFRGKTLDQELGTGWMEGIHAEDFNRATKEISAKLGISYKTADSHRTHVLKKLGVHETASLVRFAIRAGVITA